MIKMQYKIIKTKSRKSQVSQVFIYIMALFIFALIIYYGYYSISSFIKRGEEVVFIKFKTQLESEVEELLPKYGSVSIFNEKKPLKSGNVEEVCFLSSGVIDGSIRPIPSTLDDYPVIKLGVGKDVQENVFVFPRKERPSISFLRIKVMPTDFECIPIKQGRLDIRLESLGSEVLIQAYEE